MSTFAAAPADEQKWDDPSHGRPLARGEAADELTPSDAAMEVTTPIVARRSRLRWHWVFLLLLTALAGYARFAWIDRPPLWGDEAHTYSRTGGDYRDLLDILQKDGFVPLHYNLYWVIVQMCRLGDKGRWLIRVIGTALTVAVAFPLAYLLLRKWMGGWLERRIARWIGGRKNAQPPEARGAIRLSAWLAIAALAAAITIAAGIGAHALLWRLSQITFVTPRVMRFLPALTGTLMIPAIYWLAIQIVRPATALCAALVTACSAYMFVYSHDAKMYMQAWLLAVISVSCLLWWMRGGRRVAWLAWIATGLAAVGIHASCMVLPPVEFVFLLTYRKPWRKVFWKQMLLFLIGFATIMSGPAGYYLGFNRWSERVDEIGWNVSGINWVQEYNEGRTGPELVLFAATAHLYSWEWPRQRDRSAINIYTLNALIIGGTLIIGLAALGALGWSRRLRGGKPIIVRLVPRASTVDRPESNALPRADQTTEKDHPSQHSLAPEEPLAIPPPRSQPWWRQFLWLAAWIILPAYGFYCRSTQHFVSPAAWLHALGDLCAGNTFYILLETPLILGCFFLLRFVRPLRWLLAAALGIVIGKIVWNSKLWKSPSGGDHQSPLNHWLQSVHQWPALPRGAWVLLAGAIVLALMLWWRSGFTLRRRIIRFAMFIGIYVLLLGLAWVGIVSGQTFQEQWQNISTWPGMLQDSGVIAALLAAAAILSWWYCAPTVKLRLRKTLQFTAVILALYGGCWVVYGALQQVWHSAARKVQADHSERLIAYSWDRSVAEMRLSHGVPSRASAMKEAAADRPLASPQVIQHVADQRIEAAKARWDQLLHADGEQKAAETLAAEDMVWQFRWESRWMPRYIGIIWPAVIIALCALLLRLPTRPLRWAAVALVLTINLGQAYGRMFAGNEPPIDQIERDIAASQPLDAQGKPTPTDTRTYGQMQYALGGHPGSLSLYSPAARYYLMVDRRQWLSPTEFRDWSMGQIDNLLHVEMWPHDSPQMIARDVRTDPQLKRLIVWQMVSPFSAQQIQAIEAALPRGQWKITSQNEYHGRMQWWWKDLYTLQRTVLEKEPAEPATQRAG